MTTQRRRIRMQARPFSFLPMLVLVIFGQVIRASLLVRKRDVSAFAAVDPLNAITILLLMLGLVLLLSRTGSLILRKAGSSPLLFFMLYFVLCGLSASWSGQWAYTGFRTVQLAANTILMCWIMYERRTLPSALLTLIWFTAAWWALGVAGKMRLSGVGFFIRDNASACVAAMGLVMVLGAWKEKILPLRKVWAAGSLFVVGLVSGLSSAANMSAIFGTVLVFSGLRHRSALFTQALVSVVLVGIGWNVVQSSNALSQWLLPGKTQSQITTLHGRTNLWKAYYRGIQERPILGYGFPVGEKQPRVLEDGTEFGTTSAHNSIIGIAINTGLVGLVIVMLAALQMLIATNRSLIAGRVGGITMVAVMASAFMNSLTYPVVGSHWNWPTTVVQGMAGIGLCYIWAQNRSGRPSAKSLPQRRAARRRSRRRVVI